MFLGPFISYQVGGLLGFEGGPCQKIWLQRGGPGKKILSVRGGGGHQKNSFKFRSEGICDNRELNQSGISLNLGTGQTGHATPFNEREGALLFIKTSTK